MASEVIEAIEAAEVNEAVKVSEGRKITTKFSLLIHAMQLVNMEISCNKSTHIID